MLYPTQQKNLEAILPYENSHKNVIIKTFADEIVYFISLFH